MTSQDMKKEQTQLKKFKSSANLRNQKDKSLPWWVELLFVQIGLPDMVLIKLLKGKKKLKELFQSDKQIIITFLFIFSIMAYFYPVVKNSKNKLDCEKTATNFILNNKNLININRKELKMLSTNFCNGGDQIYEIENL